MAKAAARLLVLSVLAAIVAACSNSKSEKAADSNAFPAKYKDEITDALRPLFDKNETKTISGAMISDPALHQVGSEQHYMACIQYTAHGTAFNISGTAERVAYFYGGHLNQLIPADQGECKGAAYKPFPELNALCLGSGCK